MSGPSVQLSERNKDQNGSSHGNAAAVRVGSGKQPGKKKDGLVKRLYRQNLSGYVPIPRPRFAIAFFLSVGAVVLGIGVALLITALNVQQQEVRYDDAGVVPGVGDLAGLSNEQRQQELWKTNGEGWEYPLEVDVKHDLKAPVYVYYRLGNFYQNYRRYINSANWNQMHGDNTSSLSACDPIRYVYYNPETKQREPSDDFPNQGVIGPCGLWAWSFFNDTFSFEADGQRQLQVKADNLAWEWQRKHLFGGQSTQNFNWDAARNDGSPYTDTAGGGVVAGALNQNERFMVWMRPEAHYTFQKLWGVINKDIKAGTKLRITITNRYNMYNFGGLKSIVLSENSWMGGRNLFLGITMTVVGSLYFVAAAAFALGRVFFHRPMGDEQYLSWHRMQATKGFAPGFKDMVKR